jgi:hypothetical protein
MEIKSYRIEYQRLELRDKYQLFFSRKKHRMTAWLTSKILCNHFVFTQLMIYFLWIGHIEKLLNYFINR